MAMSLVPVENLNDAWILIDSESPSSDHPAYEYLGKFKEYFIQTWLENPNVFPRDLRNHHGNTTCRTTNHVEGWHNSLNRAVRNSHVDIFEMISHLKKDEEKYRLQRLLLNAGQKPPPMRKKYRRLNERLASLTSDYESNTTTLADYVKLVGYSLPSDRRM